MKWISNPTFRSYSLEKAYKLFTVITYEKVSISGTLHLNIQGNLEYVTVAPKVDLSVSFYKAQEDYYCGLM